jgi:hypothetical protein
MPQKYYFRKRKKKKNKCAHSMIFAIRFFMFYTLFFSLCLLKTRFFFENMHNTNQKKRERTSFHSCHYFKCHQRRLLSRVRRFLSRDGTEQMSSAKAGSLLERAQDAAETERAEALLKVTAGSTARVADGRLMKASSGLEEEETT